MLQQAFWLAKKEWKHQWLAIAFTVLVTILFGLFAVMMIHPSIQFRVEPEPGNINYFVIDIFFCRVNTSVWVDLHV